LIISYPNNNMYVHHIYLLEINAAEAQAGYGQSMPPWMPKVKPDQFSLPPTSYA